MALSNISNRLAKLEQSYSPDKAVVIIKRFEEGALIGYEFGEHEQPQTRIERLPGEADEMLLGRARGAVIAAYPARYCVVLKEIRE